MESEGHQLWAFLARKEVDIQDHRSHSLGFVRCEYFWLFGIEPEAALMLQNGLGGQKNTIPEMMFFGPPAELPGVARADGQVA